MSTSTARKQRREAEKNTEVKEQKTDQREGLFMDPMPWIEFMNENIPPNLQKKIIAYMNINCPKITATFTQPEKE